MFCGIAASAALAGGAARVGARAVAGLLMHGATSAAAHYAQ